MTITDKQQQRFWRYTKQSQNCWLWQGSRQNRGYGHMTMGSKQYMLAHRFSYWLHTGQHPGTLLVCHHCDNPQCVRPDHLFLGTPKDNSQDMASKNRKQDPRRLLKPRAVREIRRLYATGQYSLRELAAKYRCHHTTIRSIVKQLHYREIT